MSKVDGIPISVKANISWENVETTACSNILKGYYPPFDSDVVTALKSAGAILIGQTNMDEFGMGSSCTNSAFGNTINSNPYLTDTIDNLIESNTPPHESITTSSSLLSAGGSSGGSASSVQFRSSFASIGTDTGGSVRLPSSWCNVVGFKPTYGRISRFGVIAYASSLDTVGVIVPKAEDAKILIDVVSGLSMNDSTCLDAPKMECSSSIVAAADTAAADSDNKLPLTGKRIGIPAAYMVSEFPETLKAAWLVTLNKLESLGAEIVILENDGNSLTSKTIKSSLAAYYVIACAEASSNLAKYDGVRYGSRERNESVNYDVEYSNSRTALFGEEVKRRILCGNAVLSKKGIHYEIAMTLRKEIRNEFDNCFKQVDALILPCSVSPPIDIDNPEALEPTEMFANDVMTVGASLAGLPAISVPAGDFIGMQLIGKKAEDEKLLNIAAFV